MIKRILAGAAAAGLGLSLLGAGSAQAACSNGNHGPSSGSETIYTAPNGTTAYKSPGLGGTSGYIGVKGSTGYIEGNGSAQAGGSLRGKTNDGAADGKISGGPGSNPDVCVNGRP